MQASRCSYRLCKGVTTARTKMGKHKQADGISYVQEIDELCQEWKPEPLVPKAAPSKLGQIVADRYYSTVIVQDHCVTCTNQTMTM